MANAVSRSTLADARVVGWYGAADVVIDAEMACQEAPRAIAARYDVRGPELWVRWTAAEAAAKAADLPIALWLRRFGLGAGPIGVRTIATHGLIVSATRILSSADRREILGSEAGLVNPTSSPSRSRQ